jgi:phosphatidylserine/phosphatidylglycerophosphate/cardiolipin synthase-like enzyme
MKLSDFSIQELAKIIIGDTGECGYLTLKDIVAFFNAFGERDIYKNDTNGKKLIRRGIDYFQNGDNRISREQYCNDKLTDINNTIEMENLFVRLVTVYCTIDKQIFISKINNIITPDNYSVLLVDNECKIQSTNKKTNEIPKVKPIFEDIKKEIINAIQNAKLSIWIAMGYFTSKDIFDALKIKETENLDIRFILSTENTNSYLKFDDNFKDVRWVKAEIYGSYYNGNDKRAIMHNKYCIIDMQTVLSGSFNWTDNAEHNAENAIKIEHSENTLEYAKNFLELRKKSQKK